ncbi:MAG: hypothetical protein AAF334_05820 [Pseudomonadota bacterium]
MKRTIIEQDAARLALNEAETKWPRADDIWGEIVFILAHDPEAGKPATESGKTRAFTQQGARSLGKPDAVVLYQDADPYIIVHSVRFQEAKTYVRQEH